MQCPKNPSGGWGYFAASHLNKPFCFEATSQNKQIQIPTKRIGHAIMPVICANSGDPGQIVSTQCRRDETSLMLLFVHAGCLNVHRCGSLAAVG